MTDLRRHFERAELAEAAERLLADRLRDHPEAVRRKFYTPEQADRRERCARAMAEAMRAIADKREPIDPDQLWAETDGKEGAPWAAIRADLTTTFDVARATALAPGAHPGLEQYALKIGALASWFEPVHLGGHTPVILLCFRVEQHFAHRRSQSKASAASLSAVSRPRQLRTAAGGLFA